jgi:hypothetical protein
MASSIQRNLAYIAGAFAAVAYLYLIMLYTLEIVLRTNFKHSEKATWLTGMYLFPILGPVSYLVFGDRDIAKYAA